VGHAAARRHPALLLPLGGQGATDPFPGLAAVAGQLHMSVVGAHPDDPLLHRAGGDRQDGGVILGPADVPGQAAAIALLLLGRVVAGQVRRDDLPGLPLVPAAVHELAAVVDRFRIERVNGQGRVPIVAMLDVVSVGRIDCPWPVRRSNFSR